MEGSDHIAADVNGTLFHEATGGDNTKANEDFLAQIEMKEGMTLNHKDTGGDIVYANGLTS